MDFFQENTLRSEAVLEVKLAALTLIDRLALCRHRDELNHLFRDLETFCLFIGYPRSGHSIVGSVIDAHRHAAVAHRLNSMKYLRKGYRLEEVFYLLLRNANRFSRQGRRLTGYSYEIPQAAQGSIQCLKLVGDQEGKKNVQVLHRHPELLDVMSRIAGVRVRYVHVIRNPFDNISTMAIRSWCSLESAARIYFSLCDAAADVKRRVPPEHLHDIHYYEFVAQKDRSIDRLATFLGLTAEAAYVAACAEAIYPAPHQSRYRMPWTASLVTMVRNRSERYDFLAPYTFEGP